MFMRKVNIFLFLLVSLTVSAALKTEKISISFSEDDFHLYYDDRGCLVIASVKPATQPTSNEPCLPLFSTDIAVSAGNSYISSYLKFTKRLIRTDVRVVQSPFPVPTNCVSDAPVTYSDPYALTVYPASNCNYVASSEWGDVTVLHFQSCPFVYDAQEKNLYFIDSIELDITLGDNQSDSIMRQVGAGRYVRTDPGVLKSFVKNANAVDSLLAMRPDANDVEEKIDYVIITRRSLVSSFEPLLKWKRMKGLYSRIITMEDIESDYEGDGIQLKLKNCLYKFYRNNGLQYVLLGGDDTVVPVRGCYGQVKTSEDGNGNSIYKIDSTIPTDLYYACFGKNFGWDANGNGIYGETDDNISLSPSIYVTRVPVRSPEDVTAFVDKLLRYEKGLHWNNNILMCGNDLGYSTSAQKSDSEEKGDELYSKYIKPYWDGTRVRFYDTCTDFPTGADYALNAKNLKYQMSLGYSFMDMITHGMQNFFTLEDGVYYIDEGMSQNNSGSTIITTTACLTNAFDMAYEGGAVDPCLSESLIRNPSSGVVAYLGCSRVNWFNYLSLYYSADFQYEVQFYKNLFSYNSMGGRNYGTVVAAAKATMISSSLEYREERWVQFGLNPIGDPEMPVYTSAPKQFDELKFVHSEHSMAIETGGPRCRICIMSADDTGASYYEVYDGVQNLSLPDTIPFNIIIGITCQGYVPTFYKVCNIQNETLSDDKVYDSDMVRVGYSVVPLRPWGDVVVKNGKTMVNASDITIYSITVEKGAELIINNK